jgi:hypothetical protein
MTVSVVEVSKALAGAHFPADKDELLLQATINGADEGVLEAIQQLDRPRFRSMEEVEAQFS